MKQAARPTGTHRIDQPLSGTRSSIRSRSSRLGAIRNARVLGIAAALVTITAGPGAMLSHALSVAEDLPEFLQRAESMTAVNRPLRVEIDFTDADGAEDSAVVLLHPKGDLFAAVQSTGWRGLLPLEWGKQGVAAAKGEPPAAFGPDDLLGGMATGSMDLRPADFFPSWSTDYSNCYISDQSSTESTVSLYPAENVPYQLHVITFEKKRYLPKLFKYYRDGMSDLIRLRKDSDHTMVGARLRPGKINVRDYTENTNRDYVLRWCEAGELDEAFFDPEWFTDVTVDWAAASSDGSNDGSAASDAASPAEDGDGDDATGTGADE